MFRITTESIATFEGELSFALQADAFTEETSQSLAPATTVDI
jgi:hypothetical protein